MPRPKDPSAGDSKQVHESTSKNPLVFGSDAPKTPSFKRPDIFSDSGILINYGILNEELLRNLNKEFPPSLRDDNAYKERKNAIRVSVLIKNDIAKLGKEYLFVKADDKKKQEEFADKVYILVQNIWSSLKSIPNERISWEPLKKILIDITNAYNLAYQNGERPSYTMMSEKFNALAKYPIVETLPKKAEELKADEAHKQEVLTSLSTRTIEPISIEAANKFLTELSDEWSVNDNNYTPIPTSMASKAELSFKLLNKLINHAKSEKNSDISYPLSLSKIPLLLSTILTYVEEVIKKVPSLKENESAMVHLDFFKNYLKSSCKDSSVNEVFKCLKTLNSNLVPLENAIKEITKKEREANPTPEGITQRKHS